MSLKTVIIITDPLAPPEEHPVFYVEDIHECIKQQFPDQFPDSARIYHNVVADDHDVTPANDRDIKHLSELEGVFYIVVYPEGMIFVIIIMVIMMVVMMSMIPPVPPLPANRADNSPNNGLSNRTNQPRPGKRIPDIVGTVRSVFDLIAVPYKVFKNHEEVEYAYMCIGRGEYDVSDIRDDKTLISNISGASVEVYEPYTSPNSGDEPQLRIGDAINEPVMAAVRSNSVIGQVLRAPNDAMLNGNSNISFQTPNEIVLNPDSDIDFTKYFQAGEPLTLQGAQIYEGDAATEYKDCQFYEGYQLRFEIPSASIPAQYDVGKQLTISGANRVVFQPYPAINYYRYVDLNGIYIISAVDLDTEAGPTYYCRITLANPAAFNPNWNTLISTMTYTGTSIGLTSYVGDATYNLDGTYDILSVSEKLIILDSPSSVNADWASITDTAYLSPILSVTGERWSDSITLDVDSMTAIYANFVAANGLYKEDAYNQYSITVDLELEVVPEDSAGYYTTYFPIQIEGTANYRSRRGVTLKVNLSDLDRDTGYPLYTGPCSVRARRITPSDTSFAGSVVDEIKWADLFAMSEVDLPHFGDVTTVQLITYATESALTVKDRKANALVTRKFPSRTTGDTFSTELSATNSAADIICALSLDVYNGNRTIDEIDVDNIYDTIDEINAYFGSTIATEFNYTFDDMNMSYEEMMGVIQYAIFCTAYRYGNVLKLFFEQETEDSVMLFNHRNKIPKSENRTLRFGRANNWDGVELEYVDPTDDTPAIYYLPLDKSAVNPKKVKALGVRNKLQAHFLAWREWNKVQYQNEGVEVDVTEEASMLIRMERVLVADNARTDVQDGQVESQDGLTLTLSQSVSFSSGSTPYIFLQLPDETLQSIPITEGSAANQVVLSYAPRVALSLDDSYSVKCAYMIVDSDDLDSESFLVNKKVPNDDMSFSMELFNYDSRFYENDRDYLYGIVDEDGEYI